MNERWKEQSRIQWDEKAEEWHKKSFTMWTQGSRKSVLPAVQEFLSQGSSILDIGCGDGVGSRLLGDSGYEVTGIDPSKEMIQYANHQNSHTKVRYLEGRVEDIKFKHGSFDGAMCINSLEWMENPYEALKTIHSLLSEKGKIFIAILGPTAAPRANSFNRLIDGHSICNTMMPWEFQGIAAQLNWTYLDEVHVYKNEAIHVNKEGLSKQLKQSLTFFTLFIYEK
ncbi:class I SAM-dependent methyltransferase [Jeotgalibacillus sp. ET6]|uniref:class I SAM-dependent methyltransferase n=1 Tax=Jeotgalibacillus sp. ET6 TaxID=3037260 RepID=UPI0024184232|nr:class I SAM-dependent methyltransferase [Jeotgalibacillus sp. ET6]MDG5470584.1 class I SAM-dependent methyltransferase [Jeotgalibacillus sp. ET6]